MIRLPAISGLILCMGALALPSSGPSPEPLARFNGTLKTITPKKLTLELPDGNTIEFFCSKKTQYFDGGKKISRSSLNPGDLLTVDAKPAIGGSLDAVTVRRQHEPSSARPSLGKLRFVDARNQPQRILVVDLL